MPACPQCGAEYELGARFCPSCAFPVGEVAEKPADPLIGKTFPGGYVLLDLVGVGGMGRVYRAEQKALGRTVAVKVIHQHLLGEEGAATRFITEARASSRLNHPNVVAVIDFGRTGPAEGNLLYLVMEFLRGRDLSRVAFEEGPLPFKRILEILKQTLGALDEAHHLGIIHRDVKPENIVLEPTRGGGDFVKVVDFGLAKLRPDLLTGIVPRGTGITSPGIVCGTPDYMSPEQGRGDPLDPRSDLYALGVIMFQLLTGRLPFQAASPTQVVLMHLQQPPPDPRKVAPDRKIPDVIVDICLTALRKDRERRYADAETFIRALDDALVAIGGGPASRPSVIPVAEALPCPHCGTPIPFGQRFCGECGMRLSMTIPPASTRPARPSMIPGATTAPAVAKAAPGALPRVNPPATSLPPAGLLPLLLIGREDDVAWLEDRRREAAAGPRGARLVGEVGIGKTRLLEGFLARARADGDVVAEVAGDPSWADVGFYGLSVAITALTGVRKVEDIRKLDFAGADRGAMSMSNREEVELGLQEILGHPSAARVPPEERRYNVAAALRWAIGRASAEASGRRVIVALDDLQRLDGASRHAVSDILGEPPSCPLLVIACHTPGFDSGWPSGRSIARVISGLTPQSAAAVLMGVGHIATTSVAERLRESPGRAIVPLYLDQLVRLQSEGGGPAPARLADIIALRIERLGADARRVLQGAAVLGDASTPDQLARLVPGVGNVDASLQSCVNGGILAFTANGYRFAHPLFRDVAAATIPAGVRRDLHSRAGELAADLGLPIEVRAQHAFFSQSALEAMLLLEQVADRCTQRGDDDGAILALRRCLDLARRALFRGDIDDPEKAVVIFSRKLGAALARAGSFTDAEGILREALDLAGPADTNRARILEGLARVARARERGIEATALLREAIATASRSGARELLTSLQQLEAQWRAAS